MNKKADTPEDFHIHAVNENDTQLGVRYGITRRQASRIRGSLGIESNHPRSKPLPPPADFRTVATNMSNVVAAAHYGVSDAVTSRWRRECGMPPPMSLMARNAHKSGKPASRMVVEHYTRPTGEIADAINFLRGRGFSVFNRGIVDKALEGQYAAGRMVFDSAQAMIDYCYDRGMTKSRMW
jgi:hypothetical protein